MRLLDQHKFSNGTVLPENCSIHFKLAAVIITMIGRTLIYFCASLGYVTMQVLMSCFTVLEQLPNASINRNVISKHFANQLFISVIFQAKLANIV